MREKYCRVTLQPQGQVLSVLPGTTVIEAVASIGVTIDTPCGGAGTCGKCRVQITEGASAPSAADQKTFSNEEIQTGWRLACQTSVRNDITIHIPASSLFADQHQILEASGGEKVEIVPAIRKLFVEMPAPSLDDETPDLLRLEQAVGPFKTDIELLRKLPDLLRACGFKGTAVLADHWLIDFEAGDTTSRAYGVAFDIGTTTLVGALLDLRTGEEKALTSRMNPQIRFGDDVLSRINHSTSCPDCLEDIRGVLTHELAAMIETLCREASVKQQQIYEVTLAGNTVMQQILCGINSRFLGEVPFVPAHARGLILAARRLGIPIAHCGMAYVFPIIGGFVGGDTAAGMLATKILEREAPVLLVDIGTNGEIVLVHNGQLLSASTAAGPAFEGARITCGMRAARGAIEKVILDNDAHLGTIGNTPPSGICGSGLIDLVAELLNHGIVTPEGQLLPPSDLPPQLPKALGKRVRVTADGSTEFLVASRSRGQAEEPIVLTQRDIREVQLGAGAIRAGTSILLKKAGIRAGDIRSVLLAGGFGNFIRRNHAQRIGLLPAGIDHERIAYVGNASLSGAKWALLSVDARKHVEALARQTEHVDLSRDPDFQAEFAEAMIFPEQNNQNNEKKA
ncbi:MAG: ASKHA domain-containing protein [Kiritimatiellia bacterium]|nr:ASKHA domain-containing protein [Kiritimatiellia bacterium]